MRTLEAWLRCWKLTQSPKAKHNWNQVATIHILMIKIVSRHSIGITRKIHCTKDHAGEKPTLIFVKEKNFEFVVHNYISIHFYLCDVLVSLNILKIKNTRGDGFSPSLLKCIQGSHYWCRMQYVLSFIQFCVITSKNNQTRI